METRVNRKSRDHGPNVARAKDGDSLDRPA
jgi:hypothetical protein